MQKFQNLSLVEIDDSLNRIQAVDHYKMVIKKGRNFTVARASARVQFAP
jgi:hypothetical protein